MAYEYIKDDLAGNPFNSKYPPNYEKNGGRYHGYRNNSEETFLYDFAVMQYDLRFTYDGRSYYFLSELNSYAAQCDETFRHELQRFKDGNDVLEHFYIGGVKLLDLIDKINDVEPL